VNLDAYGIQIKIDPTKPPKEAKTLVWMRDARATLRRLIGACKKGFNKSGKGEQGMAAADADTLFWTFCHRDCLVMFMWIAWERGQRLPAHCSTILPEEQAVDVGVVKQTPSPKKNAQGHGDEFHSMKQSLVMGVQQTNELLHLFKQSQSTAGTSASARDVKVEPVLPCLEHQMIARDLMPFYPSIYLALGARSFKALAQLTCTEVHDTLLHKTEMPLIQRKACVEMCRAARQLFSISD